MVEAGTVLLNKYRIERVLGRGGMGVVALAHHLQLNQPVAIKFLLSDVLGEHTVVQRFLREAQASVRLKSEHVCRVIDVGTLETGAPYMVMEYLDGLDLSALLQERGLVYPGAAVDFILQACEALAEAHALGIVHRDLKPSNFFLTRRADGSPLIKVLDFGISKATTQVDENLTSTQSVLGTPAYMSPEQLKSSKHVDARADIWSLGVVLYELLAGHRPFTASAFSELVLKVAMDPAPMITAPLPRGLGEIVMRCLRKEPEERYPTVAEFAAALAPYAQTPSIATSAVERTSRILFGPASGAFSRAPSEVPVAQGMHTAPTVSATPWHGRPISTLSASSGEIVRPAPAAASVQHELQAAPRRRGLVAAVAGLGVVAGAVTLALVFGGGEASGPMTGPAAPPAVEPPAAPQAPPASLAGSGGEPATPPTASASPDAGVAVDAAELAAQVPDAAVADDRTTTPPTDDTRKTSRRSSSSGKTGSSKAGGSSKTGGSTRPPKPPKGDDDDDILGSRQ
ncbi:MAG: serine/threonine-protein kinase [Kofleriaceae bacterium]